MVGQQGNFDASFGTSFLISPLNGDSADSLLRYSRAYITTDINTIWSVNYLQELRI